MSAVLSAAVLTGAGAIHPGFGFLSENRIATMCEEVGIRYRSICQSHGYDGIRLMLVNR